MMVDVNRDNQSMPEGLLGELEAAVMRIIWQHEEVTVRDVWEELKPTRALAYTTVMTVMSRLVHKGLLATRKQGKLYYYHARSTPDEFVAQRAQRAVQEVLAHFGDAALVHFLRELEGSSPERLAALHELIKEEQTDAI
jgi:predicted transcriptional regulator